MSKITLKKKGKMYECQVFFTSGFPKKWKYVTDLESFSNFISRDHSAWKYFNVYEKGTKQYLKRFYPGNNVPKLLSLLLACGLVLPTHKFTSNKTFASHEIINLENTTSNKTTFNTSTNGIYYPATIPTLLEVKKEVLCTL